MKTYEEFINEGADDKDPYWGLFEINKVANQAVLNAVEYGYKKAEEQANVELAKLNKMVFDLQNAAIEMAENQKSLEYWNSYVLDKIIVEDGHSFSIEQITRMAEDIVYEKIQENLIEDGPFNLVLVKATNGSYIKYEFLVIRSHV